LAIGQIETRQIAQGGKLRDGSHSESAPDFLERDVFAWFLTREIESGGGFGIDDFLLAQFRKKRNGHLNLCFR